MGKGTPGGRPENLKPYPPGVSGNLSGRPIYKPVSDAYKKLLAMTNEERLAYKPKTGYEELALRNVVLALGHAMVPTADGIRFQVGPSLPAATELTNRVEGTPMKAPEDRGAEDENEASKLALIDKVLFSAADRIVPKGKK